jgi:nitrite reductase/ring-hydroxylating ferredoxin subunit
MEYRICNSKDIPNNFFKAFPISNIHVIIGRVNEKLFAFDNSCPHRGASLSKGEMNGRRIVCYMHGYEYDIFRLWSCKRKLRNQNSKKPI